MNEVSGDRIFRARDRILDLARPVVMGILNTTPDSFSDGGRYQTVEEALGQIASMVEAGAEIIDVGGESTRPGSDPVSLEEEMERVLPVLRQAVGTFDEVLFSIDTTKYEVASDALEAGVHIVNDVSGLKKEPRLAKLCSDYEAGYILMHSQGDPKTMQNDPDYEDVIGDLKNFFEKQIAILQKEGVDRIILDPGIGFGKKLEHNLEIINGLDQFLDFGFPLMVGASRKSMIGRLLDNRPVDERLAGTLAVHYHCLMKGALLLRVHDVQEAKDSIRIFTAIQQAEKQ